MRWLIIIAVAFSLMIGTILLVSAAFEYQEYSVKLAEHGYFQHDPCEGLEGNEDYFCGRAYAFGVMSVLDEREEASNLVMIGMVPMGAGIALFFVGRKWF